jgi:hypothetical protein
MREALEELVEAHEARLKRPNGKRGDRFMLRYRDRQPSKPWPVERLEAG